MHSILKVQRISRRCATDTVYRLETAEEGRIEDEILRLDLKLKSNDHDHRKQKQKSSVMVLFVYVMLKM